MAAHLVLLKAVAMDAERAVSLAGQKAAYLVVVAVAKLVGESVD